MKWLQLIKVFAAHAVWSLTNRSTAGRIVVSSLSSPDENVRTIAGMLIVKRGKAALPLLREALGSRHALTMVLPILGDIGSASAAIDVAQFVGDSDATVDKAARAALILLKVK